MAGVRLSRSKITLNLNGLNSLNKRQKLAKWIRKHDLTIYYVQETQFRFKDITILTVKGCKNIFCENNNQKEWNVTMLISEKIDFKSIEIKRHKKDVIY